MFIQLTHSSKNCNALSTHCSQGENATPALHVCINNPTCIYKCSLYKESTHTLPMTHKTTCIYLLYFVCVCVQVFQQAIGDREKHTLCRRNTTSTTLMKQRSHCWLFNQTTMCNNAVVKYILVVERDIHNNPDKFLYTQCTLLQSNRKKTVSKRWQCVHCTYPHTTVCTTGHINEENLGGSSILPLIRKLVNNVTRRTRRHTGRG